MHIVLSDNYNKNIMEEEKYTRLTEKEEEGVGPLKCTFYFVTSL